MHNSLQIGMYMYQHVQSNAQTPHHIWVTHTYPHTLMWVWMFTWMSIHLYAYTCIYTYPRYGILLLHSIYHTYVMWMCMLYIYGHTFFICPFAYKHMHGWVRGIISYAKQNNPICDNKKKPHTTLNKKNYFQLVDFNIHRKERKT
mgnify:FL=1